MFNYYRYLVPKRLCRKKVAPMSTPYLKEEKSNFKPKLILIEKNKNWRSLKNIIGLLIWGVKSCWCRIDNYCCEKWVWVIEQPHPPWKILLTFFLQIFWSSYFAHTNFLRGHWLILSQWFLMSRTRLKSVNKCCMLGVGTVWCPTGWVWSPSGASSHRCSWWGTVRCCLRRAFQHGKPNSGPNISLFLVVQYR